MPYKRLWPGMLLSLALSSVAVAGEIDIFVNSRAFDVAIAPVDEASKDADSSILYQRAAPGDEWENLGSCEKTTLPDGSVRFTREVDAERDGTYHYTTRPVVGGDVDNPPGADERPQAIVTVDTLSPTAEILAPAEGFRATADETFTIQWVVSDEHLADSPAALSYSGDGGKSWNRIRDDLAVEGELEWRIPADLAGPAVIRLAAIDKAGNIGRALLAIESEKPPPLEPAAKQAETPEAAAAPAKPEEEDPAFRDPNSSWLYYLMALNLMRQNKPADALQYYWLSVKADPEFIDAWADIALAYNELGAFQTARDVVEQTRDRAPERIDLVHLLGETFHAEGMDLLGRARNAEDRVRAKGAIDQAVAWYGKALDMAAKEWRLAEQAASFYRLGEVCYYVNMDRDGARAYWEKILSLHVPTPNPDLLQWSKTENKAFERRRYERNTDQWVSLHTWQNWARGYLRQLDERERAGILDMMAAQKINRAESVAESLSYSGNAMNPGREDGRSLFSLPAQLGSAEGVPASVGVSSRPARRRNGKSGMLSGGPPPAPRAFVDPYAFPRGNGAQAAWNSTGPYGDKPATNW